MKIIQCSDVVFAINCHVLKGTTEILGMKKTLFPTYSIDNNSFAAKKRVTGLLAEAKSIRQNLTKIHAEFEI